jgi:hypothetical protein
MIITTHCIEKPVDMVLIERLFGEKKGVAEDSPLKTNLFTGTGFQQLEILIQDALDGIINPGIYVSSIDCGLGKSLLVQRMLKQWKADGFPGSESFLICLATFDEVNSYIAGIGLAKADYAVISANEEYNRYGLGLKRAKKARILFISHEQLYCRVRGKECFGAVDSFYYDDKPRSCIIWDESFHWSRPVSFPVDALAALPDALVGCGADIIDPLRALIRDSTKLATGDSMTIPANIRKVAGNALMKRPNLGQRHKGVLEGVTKLAGSRAFFKCYYGEWSVIGAGLPLPNDLPPMIVLDASARLTDRYERMKDQGATVHILSPVTGHFANLTIRWIDKGAGKQTLQNADNRHECWTIVADLMNAKPEGEWLLGCDKSLFEGKDHLKGLPAELASMLTNEDYVSAVTWGRHFGSNAYRHIPNVIVMGAWDYKAAAYDAIELAKGGGLQDGEWGDTDARDMEFAGNLFQMVCRSNVRNHVDGVCGEATVYLMMPANDKRRALIERAFPGCRIETYLSPSIPPRTRAQKIIAAFEKLFQSMDAVAIADLRREIEGSEAKDYFSKPLKSDEVSRYLTANRIKREKNMFVKRSVPKQCYRC